jgi:hypothetical protein
MRNGNTNKKIFYDLVLENLLNSVESYGGMLHRLTEQKNVLYSKKNLPTCRPICIIFKVLNRRLCESCNPAIINFAWNNGYFKFEIHCLYLQKGLAMVVQWLWLCYGCAPFVISCSIPFESSKHSKHSQSYWVLTHSWHLGARRPGSPDGYWGPIWPTYLKAGLGHYGKLRGFPSTTTTTTTIESWSLETETKQMKRGGVGMHMFYGVHAICKFCMHVCRAVARNFHGGDSRFWIFFSIAVQCSAQPN